MHPKPVPSSFLGAIILPQESNDGYGRFSRHIPFSMFELMESLKYVQAHLNDLLCISYDSLEDHLKNLNGF
jgi:hypothetical protein